MRRFRLFGLFLAAALATVSAAAQEVSAPTAAEKNACGFRPMTRSRELLPASGAAVPAASARPSNDGDARGPAGPLPAARGDELETQRGCAVWLYTRHLAGDHGMEPARPGVGVAAPARSARAGSR